MLNLNKATEALRNLNTQLEKIHVASNYGFQPDDVVVKLHQFMPEKGDPVVTADTSVKINVSSTSNPELPR